MFYQVPFGFRDPDVLRRLLATNGFGDVKLDRVKLEAHSPSAKSFATGLVRGNPVSMAIQERGAAFEPIIEAVAAALAREGGDHPCRSTKRCRRRCGLSAGRLRFGPSRPRDLDWSVLLSSHDLAWPVADGPPP
jgi:hypothetical protein